MAIAAGAFGGGALASGLALAPVATLGSIVLNIPNIFVR